MRRTTILLVFAIIAAACGGDDELAATSTTLRAATLLTTTTAAPATTAASSTTSTTVPVTTIEEATWPLTGEPRTAELGPIFVAKVDNSVFSRPHAGLEEADLVIEVLVEGGIARLLAFYHSAYPERILPLRSLREVDPKLLEPFAPAVASTGGQFAVVSDIREIGNDVGLDVLGDEAYTQEPGRRGLYSWTVDSPAALATISDDDLDLLAAQKIYFQFGSTDSDQRAQEIDIEMSSAHRVVYRYSQVDGGYLRFHGEEPHETDLGAQIVARNVLVLSVEQISTGRVDSSGSPVPDYDVVGTGDIVFFQDGRVVEGRWERGRTADWFRFFTDQGDEIELIPGSTWIELVPIGRPVNWS